MKKIEMQWLFESDEGEWSDGDGNTLSAWTDDSHLSFDALAVDGQQYLVLDRQPFVNNQTDRLEVGHQCFRASPGVNYIGLVDEAYHGDDRVVEHYYRNGVAVLGLLTAE